MPALGTILSTDAVSQIKSGTFTGDGGVAQGITGIGFLPIYVWIEKRETVLGTNSFIFETSADIVDDNAAGGAILTTSTNQSVFRRGIASLDADGFTVDDNASDDHPNKNTIVYNYVAIG